MTYRVAVSAGARAAAIEAFEGDAVIVHEIRHGACGPVGLDEDA